MSSQAGDPKHVYFMGICGTAMGSVAAAFRDAGYRVTGSDSHVYDPMKSFLASKGIEILDGYHADNVPDDADFIVIGPGSLYTSIIPNLLVPEIVAAIAQRDVPRIYVCNVMTEPGETEGYSVSDHIRAIDQACGRPLFDAVLVQRKPPSAVVQQRYAQVGAVPVLLDRDTVIASGRRIILANVMDERPNGSVRHDPQRLAKVLMRWHTRTLGLW